MISSELVYAFVSKFIIINQMSIEQDSNPRFHNLYLDEKLWLHKKLGAIKKNDVRVKQAHSF